MGHKQDNDGVDEDLYEEFDDEELYQLIEQERQRALARTREKRHVKPGRIFPKWTFWVIAAVMLFHVFALVPQTFSVPAIDFLITSARLSANESVKADKQGVVVIETEGSKGTGFAINQDGKILTNYHVVEGEEMVNVAFAKEGLFHAEVTAVYPDIDLAVLNVEGEAFPFLDVAEHADVQKGEKIRFIGNPLNFNRIANEGEILDSIRLKGWKKDVQMIQAPVYRGNSGSPVFSQDGKVIGVIFATLDHKRYGKVGLFVPVDLFEQYLQ